MFIQCFSSKFSLVISKARDFLYRLCSAFIFFVVFGLIQSFSLKAQTVDFNQSSISYTVDNDGLLGTDRDYTSGLFVSLNSGASEVKNRFTPEALTFTGLDNERDLSVYHQWQLTVGQQIWTPTDITGEKELEQDRPYAGKVFIKAQLAEYSSNIADKYSVMMGIVGPRAMAEKFQKSVHSAIGSKEPVGWQNQIENKVIFSLAAQRQKLLYRTLDYDVSMQELSFGSRLQLGNYQNEIAINSTFRWGDNLSESFAIVGLTPGGFIDFGMLARSKGGSFFYTALEGRYRDLDITIDGDRPERFSNTTVSHWQSSLASGYVSYNEKFGLGFTVLVSSPDYQEDPNKFNAVASIKAFWRI